MKKDGSAKSRSVKPHFNTYERVPLELQVRVTLLVTEPTGTPLRYCFAVAVAFAVFPVLEELLLAIFHDVLIALADADALVQLDDPLP